MVIAYYFLDRSYKFDESKHGTSVRFRQDLKYTHILCMNLFIA